MDERFSVIVRNAGPKLKGRHNIEHLSEFEHPNECHGILD